MVEERVLEIASRNADQIAGNKSKIPSLDLKSASALNYDYPESPRAPSLAGECEANPKLQCHAHLVGLGGLPSYTQA